MGTALRNRFKGQEERIKADILQKGMLPVCREKEVCIDSFERYARDTLGVENPQYVTKNSTQTCEELAYTLVGAMYEKYKKMETQIETLRQENAELKSYEEKKKILAKAQLLTLMATVNE